MRLQSPLLLLPILTGKSATHPEAKTVDAAGPLVETETETETEIGARIDPDAKMQASSGRRSAGMMTTPEETVIPDFSEATETAIDHDRDHDPLPLGNAHLREMIGTTIGEAMALK